MSVGYTWRSNDGRFYTGIDTTNLNNKNTVNDIKMNIRIAIPDTFGKYYLYLYIVTDNYVFYENSGKITVTVKPPV